MRGAHCVFGALVKALLYDAVCLFAQNDDSSDCQPAQDISGEVQRISRQIHVTI